MESHERVIVALSGKAGTGKTTCAEKLVKELQHKGIPSGRVSFAQSLRQECNQQFPHFDWWQKPTPTLMRTMLQVWGQLRRSEDENYWVDAFDGLYQHHRGVLVVDDMRFVNEAEYFKNDSPYNVLIRLECSNNPLDVPDDVSETALDDYDGFDATWHYPYGNLELFPVMAYQLLKTKADGILRNLWWDPSK